MKVTAVHRREITAVAVLLIAVALSFFCIAVADGDSSATAETPSSDPGGSVSIDSISYDSGSGTVIVSGRSDAPLVNIYIATGDEFQVIDAVEVIDGRFSDTFYLGALKEGTYRAVASDGSATVSQLFEISDALNLTEARYESANKRIVYSGETIHDLVNVVLMGDSGAVSSIDACIPVNGRFSGAMIVGDLPGGDYRLFASAGDSVVWKELTVDSQDLPAGTTLSDDGKTLLRFNGDVDVYRLPSSVETVEGGAFNGSSIRQFVLDREVSWNLSYEKINWTNTAVYPLERVSGLESVVIEDCISTVPDYLFAKSSISSVVISSSVETIGKKAFYYCDKLNSLEFPEDSRLSKIGAYAFSSCSNLETVVFKSSAEGVSCIIGEGAFIADNNLKKVTTGSFAISEIGYYAFAKRNNGGISTTDPQSIGICFNSDNGITIPSSVQIISEGAFTHVRSLTSGGEPIKNTFSGKHPSVNHSKTLRYEDEMRIVFEDDSRLESIGENAFAYFDRATVIDMSECDSLHSIGAGAFVGSLDSNTVVIWSHSIETIGERAFDSNTFVTGGSTVLPASVVTIGNYGISYVSKVSFETGSKLQSIRHTATGSGEHAIEFDLTNCLDLVYEGTQDRVKLPVGVFEGRTGYGSLLDPSTPVAKVVDGVLVIEKDTVAYVINMIGTDDLKGIRCDPDNPYFRVEGGVLVFSPGDGRSEKIVKVVDSSPTIDLSDDLFKDRIIIPGALNDSVEGLVLRADQSIGKDVLASLEMLRSVTVSSAVDDPEYFAAFSRMADGMEFNVMHGTSDACLRQLVACGSVYIGYAVGGSTVFVPYEYEGSILGYEFDQSAGTVAISGASLKDVSMIGIGCTIERTDAGFRIVSSSSTSKIVMVPLDRSVYGYVTVVLDGNGGVAEDGSTIEIRIASGLSLESMDLPSFVRAGYDFAGWMLDGNNYDLSQPVSGNITLSASWKERPFTVKVDDTAAVIEYSGSDDSGTFTMTSVNPGYEVFNWTVNGVEHGSVSKPLTIAIDTDVVVGVTYRFHSSSSGLDPVSNRDLPSPDDILDLVKVYEIGGYLNTSGEVWRGHDSVPLIVDGKVFFRCGPYLYRAESDTGFIDRSVPSAEAGDAKLYYHHIGYGDGVILDYMTNKAYDLDLNLLYTLPSTLTLSGAEYHDGYFYTSGESIYRFTPRLEGSATVPKVEYLGSISGVYSTYGFTSSIFVGDVIYRIVVENQKRGIAAFNTATKDTGLVWLDCLQSMYMDDGWMSYHDGKLYVTAYSEGLFGAVACDNNARLAYMTVDGTKISDVKFYEFQGKGFASQFVVANGTGYVNCNGILYAFDMTKDIESQTPRTVRSAFGHGSMSVDITHADEGGSPVYIYMIPYVSSSSGTTFCMIEDIEVDGKRVMTRYTTPSLPQNYNSQTIRPDEDGRMIWYNDSGHIFAYTTPEKNHYFFFIDDGSKAMWYESYGRDPAEALAALGESVVTLGPGSTIGSLSGIVTDSPGIWVLRNTADTGKITDLRKYAWASIPSLADASDATSHYFLIRADGKAGSIADGTQFQYLDSNGCTKTYSFVKNIGDDRAYLGIRMAPADKTATVSFYDDDGELIDNIVGTVGGRLGDAVPAVSVDGKIPLWMKDGNPVNDIREEKFVAGSSYHLTWKDAPSEFTVTGSMEMKDGKTSVTYDISGNDSAGSMILMIHVLCKDGKTLTMEIAIDSKSMSGTVSLDTIDAAGCLIKVCLPGQSDDIQSSYGYALIAEAGA